MITNVLENVSYKDMVEEHIYEVMEYLINNDYEFSITVNIDGISFNPDIPKAISKGFSKFTVFALANYTYSSIVLTEDNISFEAGFGSENFGSVVTVPLFAVFQIVLDDSILFLNPTATIDKFFEKSKPLDKKQTHEERSRNAFSMNKKNKNLLK
ncbi:MAG: hypothetical protein U9Q30_03980 [Campylobacterota bacterium]|nr:hypothetical protein [Campylobacterota bacterium]